MKLLKTLLLITAVVALAPAKSFAGFAVPISLSYTSDSLKVTSTTTTANTLSADFGFGYILPTAPLFLGATYDYADLSGTAGVGKYTQTGYGPTVGMMTDNLYLLATYVFTAQHDLKDVGTTGAAYKKGSGFLIKLGYLFNFGGTFGIGPELSYKSIKYTEYTSPAGTTTTIDVTKDSLAPYITMAFRF